MASALASYLGTYPSFFADIVSVSACMAELPKLYLLFQVEDFQY